MSQRRATKRKVFVLAVSATSILILIRFGGNSGLTKSMAISTLIVWCCVAFIVFASIVFTIAFYLEQLMDATGETGRDPQRGDE